MQRPYLPPSSMSARIDLNHKVHVLTKKEELDRVRVPGKVVVVLDILFATTTMVAALAHGASEIVPVLDEAAARAHGKRSRRGLFRAFRRALRRDAAGIRASGAARRSSSTA